MPGDKNGLRSEAGFSVFELLVALAIFVVAIAVCLSALSSVQSTVKTTDSRSETNDQARLAVEQLDRQIRSGNLLHDPLAETPPGHGLRIYTQANGMQRCVQWRLIGGDLQTRSWPETWPASGTVSSWRTVAQHIVNSPSQPAFKLATDFEGLVEIELWVNRDGRSGGPAQVTSSVAGRNTQYQYASSVCSTVPPA